MRKMHLLGNYKYLLTWNRRLLVSLVETYREMKVVFYLCLFSQPHICVVVFYMTNPRLEFSKYYGSSINTMPMSLPRTWLYLVLAVSLGSLLFLVGAFWSTCDCGRGLFTFDCNSWNFKTLTGDENCLLFFCRYIAPTMLLDPPLDSPIMADEIFGPLLPIITVRFRVPPRFTVGVAQHLKLQVTSV